MADMMNQQNETTLAAGRFRQIPLARSFRDSCGFAEELTARPETVRRLSRLMNKRRRRETGAGVSAARLNALALIEEILRTLVDLYMEEANPRLLDNLDEWLRGEAENWDAVVRAHVRDLPPLEVYTREPRRQAEEVYLAGTSRGIAHRRQELVQVILLWLAARNPAYHSFAELFDDTALEQETRYREHVTRLRLFFEDQPHFGPDNQNLLELLASPALASPDSLSGQLNYIRLRWGGLLKDALDRLLRGLDMIREEEKPRIGGPGKSPVINYHDAETEYERYSPDGDWMPGLVMMAKSCLVWLNQLSRSYNHPIRTLDEIPDEEIATLARWGISGLWLIGIWERSSASRTIKRSCGNPEAEASAYSLRAYTVAGALGGPAALQSLKERCGRYGIRLASDMVPNHTGIDSPWLVEHPDWYVSLPRPPFPAYSFQGQDLSDDSRFSAVLEDHYYDRSDAAVVFRCENLQDRTTRYVYHGNDGTHLPWNDTAQLNYLNPDLREAVIRTILEVARSFPIIRFDAAMTLTRKHYQRLWYPPPGEGGDIPSRSEFGLSREEFEAAMPAEFWREVVDRVATEAPDTLLLAEAFWLMEGYFVRTLGMHRVYNSAFMNMLKAEENRNYRALVKNTLSFDPRILARYVNFMNNPDEETAVAQFGKADKYFGVCVLMVTMPGLPMFGHGQVEGFEEKYGMEYARAYREEEPDADLVRRHEREIFPLLARRGLFAGVENFRFYDLITPGPDGEVDENVFAYSNRGGGGSALVVVNNRYGQARGRIRTCVPFAAGQPQQEGLRQEELFTALNLSPEDGPGNPGNGKFVIFRELIGGLEYIRSADDLRRLGFDLELRAYQYQVFSDFRPVAEDERGSYSELAAHLGGRGVSDLNEALAELRLRPLHDALVELIAAQTGGCGTDGPDTAPGAGVLAAEAEKSAARLRELAGDLLPPSGPKRHPLLARLLKSSAPAASRAWPAEQPGSLPFAWLLLTAALGGGEQTPGEAAESLRLESALIKVWREAGLDREAASRAWLLLKILLDLSGRMAEGHLRLAELLGREEARRYVNVHTYEELRYFRKEDFVSLLNAIDCLMQLLGGGAGLEPSPESCLIGAEKAGYRLDDLLELLND
jgi:glycosidase